MKYRYILTHKPTDSDTTVTRTCFPLHGDDLSISIDRAEGEWYYTRKLDGKITFERDDYRWIMARPFDGTFTLNIQESHDNGSTWYDYFSGTFSIANMEIDEDNHTATVSGLKESYDDILKNGKDNEYDLMKLIPDSSSKEVHGQVPPALALVDYRNTVDSSNIFCGGPSVGNGYKTDLNVFSETANVGTDNDWLLTAVLTEANVVMTAGQATEVAGRYSGVLLYNSVTEQGHTVTSVNGNLYNINGCRISVQTSVDITNHIYYVIRVYDSSFTQSVAVTRLNLAENTTGYYSPASYIHTEFGSMPFEKIEILFHYIRATLLTQSEGNADNVLDTGDYYARMTAFNNDSGGLVVSIGLGTSTQPNGHRMIPGSDEDGGTPLYFAPMDDTWLPLAENNWTYASMWYKVTPSIANGLNDPAKFGSFSWTHCWTIGCCLHHLLDRVTEGKVVFIENTDYSQFLYGAPNPVGDGEPFQWLVTQKSNVMRPSNGGESSARCIVRLEWFFELLRNAFNCYYWLEKRNDGRYNFRVEHVEYFRRGGSYTGQLTEQIDLTQLKPTRNFLRNGIAAKRYADQTNKYTFNMDGMVEKYTYSWQGDGGSDDFLGNPMYFKAGWIEKGTSEDHQVDNIFTDLGWLMLNANTDTESSKNFSGLFLFGGYQPFNGTLPAWTENSVPSGSTIVLGTERPVMCDIYLTAPAGQQMGINTGQTMISVVGTGSMQRVPVRVSSSSSYVSFYFGSNYTSVTLHRIHSTMGNVYLVPNVPNLLRSGNNLQNGVLAWPWLQCEYLHYDIPAAKWTYLKDEYTDNPDLVWETDGTIKMVKKQTLGVVPVPDASTEDSIMGIMGVKTGLGTGIIDNAKINLSSRNAEMTIIYDINPQNN